MPDLLDLSLRDFLAATAAKQPTPGGGSVAALAGALAAALAAMAIEYTRGKKAYLAHDAELASALDRFHKASDLFQALIAEDIAAYSALSPLLKLPPKERPAHPDYLPAVRAAIRAPQSTAALAMVVLDLCAALADKTNKYILSDLAAAAIFAHATVHAGEFNIRANAPLLPDADGGGEAAALKQAASDLSQKADTTYAALRQHLLEVV